MTGTPAASTPGAPSNIAHLRLLALNDLHGQLGDSDANVDGVEIGGAATLSAYVQRERAGNPSGTTFVSAGDLMGASPPVSTLLRHQPTMAVLAAMGLDLTTFGNHEFDGGYSEAMRLIYGDGPLAEAARAAQGLPKSKKKSGSAAAQQAKHGWPGSSFPWVSANVVDTKTGKTVLPPYAIKTINGVKVAFVGAVTKDLKNVTAASGIPNIEATDPAKAVNALVPELRAKGITTIVVMVHEGGKCDEKSPDGGVSGEIVGLTKALDPEVDAVISGHSHKEYATKINGIPVVQAGSYASAIGVVDLQVDRATGKTVGSDVRLVRNDEKGIQPDPVVDKMVKTFEAKVAPKTERVVGKLAAELSRDQSETSGESTMGTVIAEAQRQYTKADIGMMNSGGVRGGLKPGPVTWGKLFSVQPFGNRVNTVEMTGAQVRAALEEQFTAQRTNILQLAGIKVQLDTSKPMGQRVVSITMADGSAFDEKKTYKVAVNGFVVDGGDAYTKFKDGKNRKDVVDDLTALVAYFENGGAPDGKLPGNTQITGPITLKH